MSQTDEEKNQLEHELAAVKSQAEELADKVAGLSAENMLIAKLVQAGASDIEAAVLVAKMRVGENHGQDARATDVDGVVAQLKKEKPHLFGDHMATNGRPPVAPTIGIKTAGAKDTAASAASALERAARKASGSGHNRASLQEYMRVRRKF